MMIIWRYVVRAGHESEFVKAYGAGGEWAALFSRAAGFLGVQLLSGGDRNYLTIDSWRCSDDFHAFLSNHAGEYEALDAATEGLTQSEQIVGRFVALAEG